jgi:hypothetical protein
MGTRRFRYRAYQPKLSLSSVAASEGPHIALNKSGHLLELAHGLGEFNRRSLPWVYTERYQRMFVN